MTRIGFATGYDASMNGREMAEYMKECDRRGFTLGFFSETIELMRDAPSSLAAFALATEQIVLASTMIVRLRTPVLMAQTIASLDDLSGGRIMVAAGACTRSHAERHSLEPIDPPTAQREWIDAIRLLLTGDAVDYDGEVVHLAGVKMGWTPPRADVPIYIPAISTKGLRLAGQIADGVVLTSISSPEYSANAIKIVRESVEEAGRDWDDFDVAQIVNCSIDDDPKAALDTIRWEVATNFNPIQVPFIARPKMRIGEPYIRDGDLERFAAAYEEGGEEALTAAIPDSYVQGMTASGAPDDVREKVERYREAGVKLPMVRAAAKHQIPRMIDLFAPR